MQEFECRSYWSKEITIFIPRNNGIPTWINHQKKGSEITIKLPENWWEDNDFLGFALCSVFVPRHIGYEEYPCSCELKFRYFYFDLLKFSCSYPCCHNGGESNIVWVAYYPKVAIENKHWSNEWRHLKLHFMVNE